MPPQSTAPPPPAPPAQKSGCWKWGALGCLAVIVIGAIGIGVLVVFIFGAIKSSEIYKGALNRAQNDPRVIAALGSPITSGFFVSGNVNVNNSTGNADIAFPIRGPKGKGSVHAVATRDSGGWHYSELTARPDGGSTIDLMSSP
jgi:hypothetical protein